MLENLIPIVLFLSIVGIVKIVSDNRTRRQLIEKGVVDDQVRSVIIGQTELMTLSNLKWGMILVAVGLAALIGTYFDWWWRAQEEALIGLMLVAAGVAFLVYYVIARRQLNRVVTDRNNQTVTPS